MHRDVAGLQLTTPLFTLSKQFADKKSILVKQF